MSEIEIAQVISSMGNKNIMIICDLFGMINHISEKCMEHVLSFNPPTTCQIFSQYNNKHGLTPKVELICCKPNPPIAKYSHHRASRPVRPKIKCTEMRSTDQQQHLSDILSSFYENYYPLH